MASPTGNKAGQRTRLREEGLMSLMDHLGELRKRIFVILLVLIAGLILGLFFAEPMYNYLTSTEQAKEIGGFHTFSLWDGIGIYMKFAFIIALVPAVPVAFFQLWSFVKPALRVHEQRAALRYVPYALFMLLLGLAFSYYVVFPMAFHFTSKVARSLGLEETYGIVQYLTFMVNIIVPISLLFELPLLLMFLTAIRILTPGGLRKMRRVAYFIMVFIGVTVTPPDVVSDTLVAIPLILLYELSILMCARIYKRQQEKDARFEQEYAVAASK
ncbi:MULTISPECIES: twin-arginine translocase subunit TatC [unclassified Paenibacillus]|uniref:twin-arginine translocase subunit TatC n=1 Tax=Paenibacillus TaxID=44249 RepID=UPI0003902E62|nr:MULTISPECIES: twin-arginine translocase subunit TatC [unclassified Paenibacillus]